MKQKFRKGRQKEAEGAIAFASHNLWMSLGTPEARGRALQLTVFERQCRPIPGLSSAPVCCWSPCAAGSLLLSPQAKSLITKKGDAGSHLFIWFSVIFPLDPVTPQRSYSAAPP